MIAGSKNNNSNNSFTLNLNDSQVVFMVTETSKTGKEFQSPSTDFLHKYFKIPLKHPKATSQSEWTLQRLKHIDAGGGNSLTLIPTAKESHLGTGQLFLAFS